MEADSEVLFKEKREGKGVKAETAVHDATFRFDFRASPPATPPPPPPDREQSPEAGTARSSEGSS